MRLVLTIGLMWALAGAAGAQDETPSVPPDASAAVSSQGFPSGLEATGQPATVATGPVAKNQAIVSVPVRHTYTGHVTQEIPGFLFAKKVVVGAPVFGLPMVSSRGGSQMVWCAPISTDSRPGNEAWSTNCFVEAPGGGSQLVMTGGLYPTMLSTGQATSAPAPEVTPGPADFGVPLSLNYVFRKWTPSGGVEMMVEVRWPRRAAFLGVVTIPRPHRGGTTLKLADGEILLTAAPDRRSLVAEIVKPLNLGAKPE